MNKLWLYAMYGYNSRRAQGLFSPFEIHCMLLTMKLAVRIFALTIVFAGVAAASIPSATRHAIPSRQAATGSLPTPYNVPGPCGISCR